MKDQKGMSLIEIVVAVMVSAFIIMGILGLMSNSAGVVKKDQALNDATEIAVAQIEAIKRDTDSPDNFNKLKTWDYYDKTYMDRYIYSQEIREVSDSIKYIGIKVYFRDLKKTTPTPDTTKPNGGKILQIGTQILKP